MPMFEDNEIEVTAIYGATTRRGLVQVTISRPTTLLSPAKAREIATFLLEAAGAAEGDEAMMTVLDRMDLDRDQLGQFLVALRVEREKIESQSSQLTVDGPVTTNEFTFVMKDGKRMLKRVVVEGGLIA